MMGKQQTTRRGPKCYHCGKFGHIKRNCRELAKSERRFDSSQKTKGTEHHAHKTSMKRRVTSSSDSESAGLVVSHALSASQLDDWIGRGLPATCVVTIIYLWSCITLQGLEKLY